jgi:hypothetical protein
VRGNDSDPYSLMVGYVSLEERVVYGRDNEAKERRVGV